MFGWIKVLNRISKEEDYLEKSEKRLAELKSGIERLEERQEQCAVLVKETSAALESGKKELETLLRDIRKTSAEADAKLAEIWKEAEGASTALNDALTKCSKLAEEKLLEIRQQAEQYATAVNAQIAEYETNFAGFNRKLDELKQAVADFQR